MQSSKLKIQILGCMCMAMFAMPAVALEYGTYEEEYEYVSESAPVTTYAPTDTLAYDTADPLFMLHDEDILSQTTLAYYDSFLRAGQYLSYGINDRLTIGANIHYQFDFDDHRDQDGFSSFDLGGVYRLVRASDNNSHIITDVLFGGKFGGSSHVRTPWFADSQYYAGLRAGRQWAGLTLAGTIKSSWIFDNDRGMSYIDFIPDAYFRLGYNWRIGLGATLRKSTNPDFDQEWLHFRLVRQYGRTEYIGHVDYEFEDNETQVGVRVNILF